MPTSTGRASKPHKAKGVVNSGSMADLPGGRRTSIRGFHRPSDLPSHYNQTNHPVLKVGIRAVHAAILPVSLLSRGEGGQKILAFLLVCVRCGYYDTGRPIFIELIHS